MLTAEQVVVAQKANVETLFDLTNKAFEGVEKPKPRWARPLTTRVPRCR